MEMLSFYKYHGAGNDFVILDGRDFPSGKILDAKWVAWVCNRHFGVGADGLMVLHSSDKVDFVMDYYNADGKLGSMCGNGGRCIASFAQYLQIAQQEVVFEAADGLHKAIFQDHGEVALKMTDVIGIESILDGVFLNTGSPHFVIWVDDLLNFPVVEKGSAYRNHKAFLPAGTNVNFAEKTKEKVAVRTFERGVEQETLACRTGVTAVALAKAFEEKQLGIGQTIIQALGGGLRVAFRQSQLGVFEEIWLTGPAQFVFEGTISTEVPIDYEAYKNRIND
jgi:diaminopimelate epimerase